VVDKDQTISSFHLTPPNTRPEDVILLSISSHCQTGTSVAGSTTGARQARFSESGTPTIAKHNRHLGAEHDRRAEAPSIS
jgi:hypothetical protein